jgi:(p)ppGpp synthase/HD superfamily hydrolase
MPSDIVTGLVRSRTGRVIHRGTCIYVQTAKERPGSVVPWQWAEGRALEEVRLAAAMVGSVPCAACDPLVPEPTPT